MDSTLLQRIVLVEALRNMLDEGGLICNECGEYTPANIFIWGCEKCGSISSLPFGRDVLAEHELRTVLRQAKMIGPRKTDHAETNAEFAKLYNISKRQASKIRRLLR